MTEILNIIEKAANSACRANAGDYEQDGLLFCGKCGTRKQVEAPWPDGTVHKVGCLCKCEQEKMEREERERKEEERRKQIERLRINGIRDTEARNKTFENSLDLPMIAKAKRYCDKWDEMLRDNIGLLFWGNTGNGKTYTAAAISNYLIDRGVPVLLTSFTKLINAVTGMFAEERTQYIDSLRNYKLLVIDDLGAERQSEFALEIVYTVINNRYVDKLPLVVTTNIPINEMRNAKNMDYQRIYDRVLEMCVPMQFAGESLRKEAAREKMGKAKALLMDE